MDDVAEILTMIFLYFFALLLLNALVLDAKGEDGVVISTVEECTYNHVDALLI